MNVYQMSMVAVVGLCIATRMAKTLIQWAGDQGWEGIEANSFEDIPMLYQMTGCAGHTFWEKCGFRRGRARGWDEEITDPGFEYSMDLEGSPT